MLPLSAGQYARRSCFLAHRPSIPRCPPHPLPLRPGSRIARAQTDGGPEKSPAALDPGGGPCFGTAPPRRRAAAPFSTPASLAHAPAPLLAAQEDEDSALSLANSSKFNSTSTLFVDSTVSSPDLEQTLRWWVCLGPRSSGGPQRPGLTSAPTLPLPASASPSTTLSRMATRALVCRSAVPAAVFCPAPPPESRACLCFAVSSCRKEEPQLYGHKFDEKRFPLTVRTAWAALALALPWHPPVSPSNTQRAVCRSPASAATTRSASPRRRTFTGLCRASLLPQR